MESHWTLPPPGSTATTKRGGPAESALYCCCGDCSARLISWSPGRSLRRRTSRVPCLGELPILLNHDTTDHRVQFGVQRRGLTTLSRQSTMIVATRFPPVVERLPDDPVTRHLPRGALLFAHLPRSLILLPVFDLTGSLRRSHMRPNATLIPSPSRQEAYAGEDAMRRFRHAPPSHPRPAPDA